MREIGIGLIGFGTVGAGVVRCLRENSELLTARLGFKPVLRRIADIDMERDRGIEVDKSIMTTDANLLIGDPEVNVVVELIGGTGVAYEYIKKALNAGKPVVTANKALLAKHGDDIFECAARTKTDIYFGASVGGGIPIIRVLREGLVANRIESIKGIVNGTCNYILSRMDQENVTFETALKAAQKMGYAESDPTLDIDGIDTAHKAVILASLAFGFYMPFNAVHIEGIKNIAAADIRYARDMGYKIKLMAVIKRDNNEVEVRVHPALIPLNHVMANVNGVYNAIMVTSDFAGSTLYYGRGAGREPTASTVLSDIVDVCRNIVSNAGYRVPPFMKTNTEIKPKKKSDIETRYYLRLMLADKPGVLAQITSILGANNISIASVLQKEGEENKFVPVVIMTHIAREGLIDAALAEINKLNIVGSKTIKFRVED